ncbi:uncharacterized protein LOC135399932 [Ornithodoros turicata]|uniref:uncharacterized protein LOC135399932 n=1 Tax=Ornithodoros turicata TaxID=34597 RepID=UPI0031386541
MRPAAASLLLCYLVGEASLFDFDDQDYTDDTLTAPTATTTPSPVEEVTHAVRSAVTCDDYDSSTNTCWFRRQVGDTLTLWLRVARPGVHRVLWRRRYQGLERTDALVVVRPDNAPWNVALGGGGGELRISPITDTDLDSNSWEAAVGLLNGSSTVGNITFRIVVLAVDLGPVFRGDQITINMEDFLTLPLESLQFKWELEGNDALPSNMRTSPSGRSLRITALRRSQSGIISCSVYSDTGLFVARRRFKIREPQEEPLPEMQGRFQMYRRRRKRNKRRARHRLETNDGSLLSHCNRPTQCSLHAVCNKETSYCVCVRGYVGNGLFCWETTRSS